MRQGSRGYFEDDVCYSFVWWCFCCFLVDVFVLSVEEVVLKLSVPLLFVFFVAAALALSSASHALSTFFRFNSSRNSKSSNNQPSSLARSSSFTDCIHSIPPNLSPRRTHSIEELMTDLSFYILYSPTGNLGGPTALVPHDNITYNTIISTKDNYNIRPICNGVGASKYFFSL
jgi:hypothetical protein